MTSLHSSTVSGAVRLAAVCTFCTVLAAAACAQDFEKSTPPTAPGEGKPGEAQAPTATRLGRYLVGDPAPDIDMKDEDGKDFRLGNARKKGPVLVAFAHDAEDALEIERARAALQGSGISTVLIAPFHRDKLADVAGVPQVTYLHDRTGRIARLYGLYDAVTSTPLPGAILVDERQRIRLIVSGIMPAGAELARSAKEAMERLRTKGKVAEKSN
jgi:peroxiredoxin